MITFNNIFYISLFLTCASLYWQECSAACPSSEQISPCTCNDVQNALPELSCINHVGDNVVDLRQIFQAIDQSGQSKEFESLVLVNNRLASLNATFFGGLLFHNLTLYDSNFTTVWATTFSKMADTLNHLLIKVDRLSTVFSSLRPLKNLKTLTLNLGLRSFKTISNDALIDLPQLQQITLNGVANLINNSAFVDLPSLQWIKINNQVEKIAANAFLLDNSTDKAVTVTIDLSNNRLDENSFEEGFIQSTFASSSITLDLSSNPLTYLPETVFKPFLEAGTGNRIVIKNGQFVCGKCENYWIIASSFDKTRLDITCHLSNQLSIWDFDWNKCKAGNSAQAMAPALLMVVVIQLLRLFVH